MNRKPASRPHGLARAALCGSMILGAGCGSNGGNGSTGSGGAGNGFAYLPCTAETNVGGFNVSLVEMMGTTPAFAHLGGVVRDGVDPVWQADTTAGDCRFMVSPTCAPACASPQLCLGPNQCGSQAVSHSVGSVDITGLSIPVSGLTALAAAHFQYDKDLSSGSYPPAAPGTLVTLHASGGDYVPFTLGGRGIEPLVFEGTGLTVNRDQNLAFTWTAPAQGATGKIRATLNIAFHGGIRARVDCELDDDGSAEISSVLVNKLLDAGTAGFPILSLTRRSVDSTTLSPPGCVELAVDAYVERQVTVCPQPGMCVISCGPGVDCPTGQICGNDKKCGI